MAVRPYKGILPKLGNGVFIDEAAVVIGDVTIGEDSSVWPQCSIRGDVNRIRIGNRSNIQDGTVIHVTYPHNGTTGHATIVGDDVTVGHQCILHGCTIGNRVLVGMGSQILDGAIVQDGVFIGAGSLVTEGKVLESGHLYVGRPAKKARELTEEEKKWFEYSAKHYVRLKNDYSSS